MKKLLLSAATTIFSISAFAQALWQPSGSNVVYTNRNTGILTSSPSAPLDVNGKSRFRGNATFDSAATALNMIAQNANFATAVITGQITAGSLVVNGNATVTGQLTTSSITSSSGTIDFGSNTISTIGNIFSPTISALQSADSVFVSQISILHTNDSVLSTQISNITSSQWTTTPSGIEHNGNVFVKNLSVAESVSIGSFRFSNGGKDTAIISPPVRDSIVSPKPITIAADKSISLEADTVLLGNGSGKVRIDPSPIAGNVRLSVEGDVTASGNITANCVTASCLNVSGQTQFDSLRILKRIKIGSSLFFEGYNPPGTLNEIYTDNVGDFNLYIQSNPPASTHAIYNNNTILNFNSTGNVGIGTATPGAKLHVTETGGAHGIITSSVGGNGIMATVMNGGNAVVGTASAGNGGVFSSATGFGLLVTSGKVKIGTLTQTLPPHDDYLLSVDGKIVARKMVTTALNWADDELLTTATTEELEKEQNFIIKFGHLQKVPSEKEIFKNGIIMDEMFAIQLRKIEQLFKYSFLFKDNISELKQENEELKKKTNDLQKQISAMQQQINSLLQTK